MFLQKSNVLLFTLTALIACASSATGIRVAIPNKVKNLDPRTASIAQERFMLPLVYDGLFLISEDGEIQNQIAKSWDYDETTKEFKVVLAGDTVFSDGSKLTANDVVFSFNELCKPQNITSKLLEESGACANKITVDPKNASVLKFKIKDSANDFLFKIGSGRFPIFKDVKAKLPIGTGHFKIVHNEETQVRLEPNPYYRSAHPAQSLEFIYVTENDLQSALARRSIDVATMYLGSTVGTLNLGSYKVVSYSPVITQTLILNDQRKPFDSPKFRKAFYSEISGNPEFLKCKRGSIPANGFIPNGIGGSIAAEKPHQEKIDLSDARLKKKSQVKFVRHISRKNECEEAIVIQAGKKLNLDVQFQYLDDYEKLLKIYADKSADGYLELYVFGRDASIQLSRFTPINSQPVFYYTDKKIADLLEAASKENLLRTHFQYFRQITESIKERASVVPLYYESHTNVLRSCLYDAKGEVKPNPNSFLFLLSLPNLSNCTGEDK